MMRFLLGVVVVVGLCPAFAVLVAGFLDLVGVVVEVVFLM